MARWILAAALSAAACTASAVEQIHLALAGDFGMSIVWQTECGGESIVAYGTQSGALNLLASGEHGSTYIESFSHTVVLEELAPAATYYYRVADDPTERSFRAAPVNGTDVSFAVFGDLGLVGGDVTRAYLAGLVGGDVTRASHLSGGLAAKTPDIDLVWHMGDVAYADNAFIESLKCSVTFCYEDSWDSYLNAMEPVASRVPYMVGVGNHEGECHSPACIVSGKLAQLGNFTAYNARFRMPSAESGGSANMWYSFNHGPVHFINIDTEADAEWSGSAHCVFSDCGGFMGPGGIDQLAWLANDLKQANSQRNVRPWVVVQGHRPMYEGDKYESGFAEIFEGLFREHGVDMYLSGHVHSYERTLAVHGGAVAEDGIPHIMIGGAGNSEMRVDEERRLMQSAAEDAGLTAEQSAKLASLATSNDAASEKRGVWTASMDTGNVGIGLVQATMSTMSFQYVRTATGEVFDSLELSKN